MSVQQLLRLMLESLYEMEAGRHIGEASASPPPGSFYRPEGTRRFSSSNQLSTTLICVAAEVSDSTGFSIRKRWPSGVKLPVL